MNPRDIAGKAVEEEGEPQRSRWKRRRKRRRKIRMANPRDIAGKVEEEGVEECHFN